MSFGQDREKTPSAGAVSVVGNAPASTTGKVCEDGEHRIGLRAIAAPIADAEGRVRYTIGVVGMFRRVHSEEFTAATHLTQEAARSIAAALQRRV